MRRFFLIFSTALMLLSCNGGKHDEDIALDDSLPGLELDPLYEHETQTSPIKRLFSRRQSSSAPRSKQDTSAVRASKPSGSTTGYTPAVPSPSPAPAAAPVPSSSARPRPYASDPSSASPYVPVPATPVAPHVDPPAPKAGAPAPVLKPRGRWKGFVPDNKGDREDYSEIWQMRRLTPEEKSRREYVSPWLSRQTSENSGYYNDDRYPAPGYAQGVEERNLRTQGSVWTGAKPTPSQRKAMDARKSAEEERRLARTPGSSNIPPRTDIPSGAVDLGLPSGTLWADHNVGASSPEQYGGYYAWAETRQKSEYSWENYSFCKGSENTQLKYNCSPDYGVVDDRLQLLNTDDVAATMWGGGWKTPTLQQWEELLAHTASSWTMYNGVSGRIFIGINGCSIFLPASGYKKNGLTIFAGSDAVYWSATMHNVIGSNPWSMFFYDGFARMGTTYYRYCGCSVRPVCK